MATRTPQRGAGGEAADVSRKERRHGKSELSPRLTGAMKAGGKMAAEEAAMAVFPAVRIAKMIRPIVGKGAKALGKAMGRGVSPYNSGSKTFSSMEAMKAAEKAHDKAGFDDDLSLDLIYGDGPDLPNWWKRLPEKEKVKIYKQHNKPKDTDFVDKKTGNRKKIGGGWDILGLLTGDYGKKNSTEQAVRLFAETGKNPAIIKQYAKSLSHVIELKPALRKAAEAKAKK
tara:strand:+ start:4133 stop:4816 length:684 start_codon:yes stop_codon:yes gene_type:complete